MSATANAVYERAYSDCASNKASDLARQYNAQNNRNAIATAVATYWAKQAGGGADAVDAGKAGCFDGFPFAPKG